MVLPGWRLEHYDGVTGPGQILTIKLKVFPFTPFAVMTERFDPVAHIISAVTLLGHPLAGWRYWRVYSIGTNDVVIETGAYDQPAGGFFGSLNYAGYYIFQGTVKKSWMEYLQNIKLRLSNAPQGSHLKLKELSAGERAALERLLGLLR